MSLAEAREALQDEADATPTGNVRAEETADGLTIYHDSWPVQIGEDWTPLLEFFGYTQPDLFEVVEDSVKQSKWMQSKGHKSGTRDVIWLYSYKARFRKKSREDLLREKDLEDTRAWVKTFKPKLLTRKTVGIGLGEPVTYAHAQGDEQIGKGEGGGIEGFRRREAEAIERSIQRCQRLMAKGYNVTSIADLATADRIENTFGHYPSQQRTTATMRVQLAESVDSDIARTRAFAELGLPITKAYTPSNHGEMRQVIGQSPYTSESDNWDLIIAESAKRVLDESALADQITWHIPHDEYLTRLTIAGVNTVLTHGHKAKGTYDKWVLAQRDNLNQNYEFRPRLFIMGHKHHFYAEDVGGTTILQTPSLDGGSPYFEAAYGNKATHGILSFLIGPEFRLGFAELSPL